MNEHLKEHLKHVISPAFQAARVACNKRRLPATPRLGGRSAAGSSDDSPSDTTVSATSASAAFGGRVSAPIDRYVPGGSAKGGSARNMKRGTKRKVPSTTVGDEIEYEEGARYRLTSTPSVRGAAESVGNGWYRLKLSSGQCTGNVRLGELEPHLGPLPSRAYHQSPTTYHLPPTTYHLPPATCHLPPPTTYHLPRATRQVSLSLWALNQSRFPTGTFSRRRCSMAHSPSSAGQW